MPSATIGSLREASGRSWSGCSILSWPGAISIARVLRENRDQPDIAKRLAYGGYKSAHAARIKVGPMLLQSCAAPGSAPRSSPRCPYGPEMSGDDWQPVPRTRLLCRDCRFSRPNLGLAVAFPFFWFLPALWRDFWEGATCRHPKCRWTLSGPSAVKSFPMSCGNARSRHFGHNDRCGPDAEYFSPRRLPHLLTAAMVAAGITAWLAYVAFLKWILK